MPSRRGTGKIAASTARCLLTLFVISRAGWADSHDQHPIADIFKPLTTPGNEVRGAATLVMLVCLGIFLTVASLLTYALIRYRLRGNDNLEEPPQVYGSNYIEAAWTVIPILIVFVLLMVTARVVSAVQDRKPPANTIHTVVVGHQWWWEVRYPDFGFVTANEVNMPVAGADRQPTFFSLESVDVAHSFWIPQLGGKMDVIPNRRNEWWADPEQTGTFYGNCAEYCGTQHANMLLRAVVLSKEEFPKWVEEQKKPAVEDPSAVEGRDTFLSLSCVNCHMVRGTAAIGKFGPDLTHLMSRQTLGAGLMKNSKENLRAWIKDPQEIKPGCMMPNMQLTTEQLDKVTAYLASLR